MYRRPGGLLASAFPRGSWGNLLGTKCGHGCLEVGTLAGAFHFTISGRITGRSQTLLNLNVGSCQAVNRMSVIEGENLGYMYVTVGV